LLRGNQYLYGNLANPFQVTASRSPDNVLTVYYYDAFGALYAFERGSARYYVGSDHLGTPKVITDNTGSVKKIWEYDSWGVRTTILDNDATIDLPIGFAGGIPDDATGLVRFGFRDYELGTGRWTAKDPIFFKSGQFNLFLYPGNDPVNLKDPSGLQYTDVNMTVPIIPFVGVTGGMMATPEGKNYPYLGVGGMTSPGASVTTSPNDPSPGWNVGIQYATPSGAGVQFGLDQYGNLYVEGGTSTPGASVTLYYVFAPSSCSTEVDVTP
jgi:RHS repeat-associated protein